jgi:hypothetical protein
MLSVDPGIEAFTAELPQTASRYSYTFNAPIRLWDPDGRNPAAFAVDKTLRDSSMWQGIHESTGSDLAYALSWREPVENTMFGILGATVGGTVAGSAGASMTGIVFASDMTGGILSGREPREVMSEAGISAAVSGTLAPFALLEVPKKLKVSWAITSAVVGGALGAAGYTIGSGGDPDAPGLASETLVGATLGRAFAGTPQEKVTTALAVVLYKALIGLSHRPVEPRSEQTEIKRREELPVE